MPIIRRIAVLALLAVSLVSSVVAQTNPVTFSIKSKAKRPLKQGDRFLVQVIANIKEGWHLYATTAQPGGPVATRITMPSGQPFKLAGEIRAPLPLTEYDANFGIDVRFYEGAVVFPLSVALAAVEDPGEKETLRVKVFFQTCNDKLCLPPKTLELFAPVEIDVSSFHERPNTELAEKQSGSSVALSSNQSPSSTPTATPPTIVPGSSNGNVQTADTPAAFQQDHSSRPLLSFIWLAMVLGALSLLTPCVFPMIPITVSYFTSHTTGNRVSAIRYAAVYALGIIFTFTALGVVLAIVFGATGINKFAANPWVNLVIATIFISFALSLLGTYDLRLPSSVLTKLDSISRNKETAKIIGLLLMGLTFSLTSFTCTAPFVGTLLVMASQGKWLYPIVGMLAFSSVFALPFFALAVAPQLLSQLPRSGGWLTSVKVMMGLLEIAAAVKFISNADLVWRWSIVTREVVLASWLAVVVLIGFYFLGLFQLPHDSPIKFISPTRLLVSLIALALGFYLFDRSVRATLGRTGILLAARGK